MRIPRVVPAVAALAAIAIAFVSARAAGPRVIAEPGDGANGSLLPFSIRAAKHALDPSDPRAKIESGVQATTTALARLKDPRSIGTITDSQANVGGPGLPVDSDGRLYLRVAGANLDAHLAELEALGVTIEASVPSAGFLEAWIPAARVIDVASITDVRLIGLPGTPVYDTGNVLSQGDLIHRASQARTTFSVDGTGARVGVISDGVTSLLASQATLDLPAVQVGVMGTGDEGTAMLEIVHDLAPGAGLAFHSGGSGSAGIITAMNWLATTGNCRTIVDDLWMTREPYFQDGPVAQAAANLATNVDVAYFTSAGNRATRHIPQPWKDGGARNLGTLGAFRPHDFGGGDVLANVRLRNPGGGGVRHTIVLQWSEPIGASAQDFDLYLLNSTQTAVIASSTNLQDGNDDPFELIDFTWNGADNTPAFLVVDFAGPGAVPANGAFMLKIAANGPTFQEYVNAVDSVNPHARSTSVFAVAAIDASDPGNDTAENFSSVGPATMRVPGVSSRNKPDASAVDGVQVTGVGGFTVPFFGTSAAAPHAAAIAALVRGARPDLNEAQVLDVLRTTAIDVGPAVGWDGPTGAGRVDAFSALASVLNEPPVADAGNDTTVECTGPPGTSVKLDGTRSSDPDGDAITYSWSAPNVTFDDPTSATPTGVFPLGSTTVTLTVDDGSLNDSDEVVVTIEDTQPPVVSVTLVPDALWPPNHKMADIRAIVTALDECDPSPVIRLLPITSNEPDNGLGDGDTADDIQGESVGTADYAFQLRSERMGPGDTRVYTVCYESEDASGNVGTGCATVTVTHDQSASATFTPAGNGDPYSGGGWLDFAIGGLAPAQTDDERGIELGSASFARRVPGGDSPTSPLSEATHAGVSTDGTPTSVTTFRWFVSASDLSALALQENEPVLFARFDADGAAWLASVQLPPPPANAVANAGVSTDGTRAVTAAAPLVLALRAPVPVRAGGTVELVLPQDGPVLARLVTATGRIVGTLAREARAAGTSSLALPRGLAAGIYVVAVDTPQGATRAKIVVLP